MVLQIKGSVKYLQTKLGRKTKIFLITLISLLITGYIFGQNGKSPVGYVFFDCIEGELAGDWYRMRIVPNYSNVEGYGTLVVSNKAEAGRNYVYYPPSHVDSVNHPDTLQKYNRLDPPSFTQETEVYWVDWRSSSPDTTWYYTYRHSSPSYCSVVLDNFKMEINPSYTEDCLNHQGEYVLGIKVDPYLPEGKKLVIRLDGKIQNETDSFMFKIPNDGATRISYGVMDEVSNQINWQIYDEYISTCPAIYEKVKTFMDSSGREINSDFKSLPKGIYFYNYDNIGYKVGKR